MKFLAACLALLPSIGVALPGDPPDPAVLKEIQAARAADEKNPKVVCGRASKMAREIMNGRQAGVPMSEMMSTTSDDKFGAIVETWIIEAYEHPRFSTPNMQEKAVVDFENSAYLQCFKAMRLRN